MNKIIFFATKLKDLMSKKYLHTQRNFSKFAFLCLLFDSRPAVNNIRKTTIKGGFVDTLSVDCRFQIVMAPKKSELPISLREKIVSLRENGLSYREIGKKVNVCFSTVRYVIKRHKERGSTSNNLRSGRPKKLSQRIKRKIIRDASKNPFVSAITLANDVASTSGVQICAQSVRNVLHDAQIYGRSPRKKPFINERNRLKRLDFAKEYINKPIDFWQNVIFSDESKFNIFKSDGRKLVWRKPCTAFHTKNVLPTVKHGGGSVMVWGCMASKGVGKLCFIDGNMTARIYIDVLRDNLPQSAIQLGISNSYYFQQDNDPKHTAGITRMWLLYNVPRRLATPPQSPDLNPLENLWDSLDLKIRKRKISSKSALKKALIEEWSNTDPIVTENLIKSMPKRLQAVIDANGMHTKY